MNITRNKKKKHDKILMLARSKLNSTEILKEKDKYEEMKENLRSKNEEYKIMRLSSIKSKIKKNKK